MPRIRPVSVMLDLVLAALAVWVSITTRPEAARWVAAGADRAAWWAVVALASIGLAIRSWRTPPSLGLLTVALAVHVVVFDELSILAVMTGLVGVWTSQSRLAAPWRTGVLIAAYLAAGVAVLRMLSADGPLSWDDPMVMVIPVTAWSMMTVAALAGASRRRGRQRVEAALERADIVRRTMAAEHSAAVASERNRIARDVHDLLGHSLAVIAMQAAGARAVVEQDPAAAKEALGVIGLTARNSSQEVAALVDVLRDDAAPAVGGMGSTGSPSGARPSGVSPPHRPARRQACATPERPQEPDAGIRALAELMRTFRQAGMVVEFRLVEHCEPGEAEAATVREVLREALTNAARHAPGAPVTVSLRSRPHGIDLTVDNPLVTAPEAVSTRRGLGIESMTSRVGAVGGTLHAGVREGGWQVRAALPCSGAVAP